MRNPISSKSFASMQVISAMLVGHLGELPLSGASLATSLHLSLVSVCWYKMGMVSALDTLCGQSFGAGHHHMIDIHMQRATFVLSFQVAIAEEAGVNALYLIPSLFVHAIFQCLLKFLQTQNIVFPMVLRSAVIKSGLGSKVASCRSRFSIIMDQCAADRALCEVFFDMCKIQNCLLKEGLAKYPRIPYN
ncbi:hypothetical protein V8G54_012004 [Vigna mungo]|uniref:Uncharacterized protein n=1 Tax=Vigna mungo TaxID=3915 RepID=A0AAQ3NTX4_VIGMU